MGWVHDSAASGSSGNVPGTTDGPALTFTRRLWVNDTAMCVPQLTVSWWSNMAGAASGNRKIPPLFGVWAWTRRGRARSWAASTASAAPPTRKRSRRVMSAAGYRFMAVAPAYFLKRLSNPRRMSPGRVESGEASRSTVTRNENPSHSLRAFLSDIRSRIGCAHSKRRPVSK